MTTLEEIARRHARPDSLGLGKSSEYWAILAALRELREEVAKMAEWDSMLDWVGGSTGSARGTSRKIADAIRRFGEDAVDKPKKV